MINFIGTMPARGRHCWRDAGLHLHDYGKEPRPDRKLGHCTLVERTAARGTAGHGDCWADWRRG